MLSHIKSLHRAALRVSNATLYEVQILQDQLEDADRAHQQAEVREQALLEALQARQHRIAELETERKQLEISWTTERMEFAQISGELQENLSKQSGEVDRLRREVERLEEQLRVAHQMSIEAAEKCQRLERMLESVEDSTGTISFGESEGDRSAMQQEMKKAQSLIGVLQAEIVELKKNGNFDLRWRESDSRGAAGVDVSRVARVSLDGKTPKEIAAMVIRSSDSEDGLLRHNILKRMSIDCGIDEMCKTIDLLLRAGFVDSVFQFLHRAPSNLTVVDVYDLARRVSERNEASGRLAWRTMDDALIAAFAWKCSADGVFEMLKLMDFAQDRARAEALLSNLARQQKVERFEVLARVLPKLKEPQAEIVLAEIRNLSLERIPHVLKFLRQEGVGDLIDLVMDDFVLYRSDRLDELTVLLRTLGMDRDLRSLEERSSK
ncbi:hypothetical protein ABZ951_12230 [Streptomyces sp. NPDC046215]|uniref:hypothetical protein n=1 Tax=Streptomyces TaxID=1883 RepID=UPI0031DDD7D2